jgi:hypothetical protein
LKTTQALFFSSEDWQMSQPSKDQLKEAPSYHPAARTRIPEAIRMGEFHTLLLMETGRGREPERLNI